MPWKSCTMFRLPKSTPSSGMYNFLYVSVRPTKSWMIDQTARRRHTCAWRLIMTHWMLLIRFVLFRFASVAVGMFFWSPWLDWFHLDLCVWGEADVIDLLPRYPCPCRLIWCTCSPFDEMNDLSTLEVRDLYPRTGNHPQTVQDWIESKNTLQELGTNLVGPLFVSAIPDKT